MAKRTSKGSREGKKPTRRSARASVSALLPATGKAAKEKQHGVRSMLILSSLLGGEHQKGRPISLNTSINQLKSLRLSEAERDCMHAAMRAEGQSMPKRGVAMGYRIEIAAAFVSMIIHQAYSAAGANEGLDPDVLAQTCIELAVERAKEIWSEDDEGDD